MWEVVCKACMAGREYKTIGVLATGAGPCPVCGSIIPAAKNGGRDGFPVRPDEVAGMRAMSTDEAKSLTWALRRLSESGHAESTNRLEAVGRGQWLTRAESGAIYEALAERCLGL